jgi:hypothetical protein
MDALGKFAEELRAKIANAGASGVGSEEKGE